MDENSEMLVGIEEGEQALWEPVLHDLSQQYPHARLHIIPHHFNPAHRHANPKVAWQEILAAHASGELWLWSDADIIVPPDYLNSIRYEFETGGFQILSNPYVVRRIEKAHGLCDAFFVNLEFFPGVCLFYGSPNVRFALGAGMLFRKSDFIKNVDWEKTGNSLTDDYILGNSLQPSGLSRMVLETQPGANGWIQSLLHYYRWQKTICWCRPLGFFGQIMIMPAAGWAAFLAFHPGYAGWIGLVSVLLAESLWASLIFHEVKCRLKPAHYLLFPCWSLGRILVWTACWLPLPVKWRDTFWWRPVAPKHGKR